MALFRLPGRKRTPEDAPSCIARGEACNSRGDFAAAITWFDKALDADSRSIPAYTGKGLSLKKLGRDTEARACFNSAFEIGCGRGDRLTEPVKKRTISRGTDGTGVVSPPETKQQKEPADLLSADAWYDKAVGYGAHGDFSNAVNCFDNVLAQQPGNVEAWIYRGRALGMLGRFTRALDSFEHALAIRPDDTEALYYKGISLVRLRKIPDAYPCFEKVLMLQPDHEKAAAALENLNGIMKEVKGSKRPGTSEKRKRRSRFL